MKRYVLGVAAAVATGLAVAFTTVSPASAVSMTGQFSITGADIFDTTANTIKFLSDPPGIPAPVISLGTGDFAALNGTTVTFAGQGTLLTATAINYTNLAALPVLFTGSSGLVFSVISNTFSEGANNTSLTVNAIGTLSLTGFTDTPGIFSLTTQNPKGGTPSLTVSFSATTVAVPGPIVGAGLPGLLLACAGLLLLARRRRARLAA
jgi:hypothetical protein